MSDNGATSHYIYDAQGIRVLKSNGSGQDVFLNAKPAGGGGGVGNFNVYVNPYLVLKSGSYTKHFYIESQRIVSKLGDTPNLGRAAPAKAGEGKVDYGTKKGKVWESIVKNLKFLGQDGDILTAGKSGKIPPGQLNDPASTGSGQNEKFQFFYHPDHVGSTSYITDAGGEVYQHLEYFAFGETFVEEHSNTNRTPYLFNGKELDDETGLYYYGSRYYDPQTSIWKSVDNYADKYPGLSSYSFCANNPVNYTDPTGDTIIVRGSNKYDKSLYDGAFQKHANEYLDKIKSTPEGKAYYDELQKSEHLFEIVYSGDHKNPSKQSGNRAEAKDPAGAKDPTKGSGGIIYFDPYSNEGGNNEFDASSRGPEIGLAHELFGHGLQYKRGTLSKQEFKFTSNGTTYKTTHSEVDASHRENIIRSGLGVELRKDYAGYPLLGPENKLYPNYNYGQHAPKK